MPDEKYLIIFIKPTYGSKKGLQPWHIKHPNVTCAEEIETEGRSNRRADMYYRPGDSEPYRGAQSGAIIRRADVCVSCRTQFEAKPSDSGYVGQPLPKQPRKVAGIR